jgi:hypothetical protein
VGRNWLHKSAALPYKKEEGRVGTRSGYEKNQVFKKGINIIYKIFGCNMKRKTKNKYVIKQ